MIKIIGQAIYYQILIFLRIKQAVFFSIVFPVFLFLTFGNLWGSDNEEYIAFILPGIIGMTIASDGLFAVGPVIKDYYTSGLIKYLRKLPFSILYHFIGLILSRILSLLSITTILCLTAKFVFHYSINSAQLFHFISGIFLGLFLFSFIGLALSFSDIKNNSDKTLVNLVYFIFLFTSNTFYLVGAYNSKISFLGNIFPLNAILNLLRGNGFHYSSFLWLTSSAIIFYYLFNKMKWSK